MKISFDIWKKIESMKSERFLASLSDAHAGEDAVIVGMGPSLRISDLKRISSARSFACNKAYLAFDDTAWRPDYYSVVDTLIAEQYSSEICKHDFGNAVCIHSNSVNQWLSPQKNSFFYSTSGDFRTLKNVAEFAIPNSIAKGLVAGGCTVIVDQIQLAYIMGFKRVFLIGIDFSWGGLPRDESTSMHGSVVKANAGANHFHPKYYKQTDKHTTPKIEEQLHAYKFCRHLFESDNRQLINASRRSCLEILNKVSFDDVFPE
jgi:hypothetical protein